MRNRFDVELEDLNLDLIRMGARAEQTITKVVKVIENCDAEGAKEIIEDDDLVDAMAPVSYTHLSGKRGERYGSGRLYDQNAAAAV